MNHQHLVLRAPRYLYLHGDYSISTTGPQPLPLVAQLRACAHRQFVALVADGAGGAPRAAPSLPAPSPAHPRQHARRAHPAHRPLQRTLFARPCGWPVSPPSTRARLAALAACMVARRRAHGPPSSRGRRCRAARPLETRRTW
eukprot:scaffold47603_cov68-Phaeocystis_antarctica.AAC.5